MTSNTLLSQFAKGLAALAVCLFTNIMIFPADVHAAQPVREVGRIEAGIKVGFGSLLASRQRPVFGTETSEVGGVSGVHQVSFLEKEKPLFGFGQAGLEVRYNFAYTGFDAGVEAMFLGQRLKRTQGPDRGKKWTYGSGYFGAVSNYNILQEGKVNPYAGLGLGAETRGGHFMVAPRVGVELFYHLRVEVGAYLGHRDYNMLMVSVAGVIGGRPKGIK